jgi:hypothetical protein
MGQRQWQNVEPMPAARRPVLVAAAAVTTSATLRGWRVAICGCFRGVRVVVVTDEAGNSKLGFDYPDGPVKPRPKAAEAAPRQSQAAVLGTA